VKRSVQRPFSGASGGISKIIKTENSKSRMQTFNQKNFSMYENSQQTDMFARATQNSESPQKVLNSKHEGH
jgi:hypothetical protein